MWHERLDQELPQDAIDGLDPLRAVVAGMDDWLAPDGLLVTFLADEQHIAARTVVGARRVVFVLG